MPRIVEFKGVRREFPDAATDADIAAALSSLSAAQQAPNGNPVGYLPPVPGGNNPIPHGWPSATPSADRAAAAGGIDPATVRKPYSFDAGNFAPSVDPGRALQLGVQGVGRGAADIAGSLPDLTNAGINLGLGTADLAGRATGIGSVPYRLPVGAADTIANAASSVATAAGAPPPIAEEDMTSGERARYSMTRYGSQAGLTGGALAARNLAAPVVGAAAMKGPITRALDTLAKPYANSAAPLVGDVAGGMGAGAAKNAYDEYAPDFITQSPFGPLGALLSMLAGGAGGIGLTGAVDTGVRAAKNVGRTLAGKNTEWNLPPNATTGEQFTRPEADRAASIAQGMASNPKNAAIDVGEYQNAVKDLPGGSATPTAGLASNDVGLTVAENAARAKNSVPFIERDQQVNQRVRDLVNEVPPKDAVSRDFTNIAADTQALKEQQAADTLAAAQSRQGEETQVQQGYGAPVEAARGQGVPASKALDTVVRRDTLAAQDRKNELFDPNDARPLMRDAAPLVDTARAIRGRQGPLSDPANVPPVVDRIETLIDKSGVPGQISFGDMQSVRPEISQAITKARKAGDYTVADNLREIKTVIDQEVERLAAEGGPVGQRAQEALRYYREDFAPVWNVGGSDPATQYRKDLNLDRFGTSTTPPSETAGKFLGPKRPEDADSLRRILNASPTPAEGIAATRQYLLADMAEGGVLDQSGVLRPDALRNWRDKWGTALDVVPDFRDEVAVMLSRAQKGKTLSGNLAAEVKAAEAALSDTKVNTGALGLALGKDPVKAVQAILSSGDPERNIREILDQIGGNVKAVYGLKSSVRDYLMDTKTDSALYKTTEGDNPINFKNLDDLFKKYEGTLAQIYTPEEMNRLRGGHKLLAPLASRGMQATVGSQTAERGAFWKPIELAVRTVHGALQGGAIMKKLHLWADTLPSNEEAAQQLVKQMWFDPAVMQHLLTRDVGGVDSPLWNAKLAKLIRYSAAARDMDNPNEKR